MDKDTIIQELEAIVAFADTPQDAARRAFRLAVALAATPDTTSSGYQFAEKDVIAMSELVRNDNKIAAIKLARQVTGIGLKEAKHYVDTIITPASNMRNIESRIRELQVSWVRKSNCTPIEMTVGSAEPASGPHGD